MDDATFATDYARTNPSEVFAESVAAYFLHGRARVASVAKWDYIDGFVRDLMNGT